MFTGKLTHPWIRSYRDENKTECKRVLAKSQLKWGLNDEVV
jgi:hypothetical protein